MDQNWTVQSANEEIKVQCDYLQLPVSMLLVLLNRPGCYMTAMREEGVERCFLSDTDCALGEGCRMSRSTWALPSR